jgi:hypothetical protein
MGFPKMGRYTLLSVVTIIPGVLLASFFLFLGVVTLVSPDVPENALAENTVVGAMLILTAAVLIYALLRPYSGGFFLCICAVPFALIFNAFHLSNVLYPSRDVGYAHFFSAITGLILMLGVLSVIRSRLSRGTASEDSEQPS